jgi:hypothetical protein
MSRFIACSAALALALGSCAARAGEVSASLGIFTLSRGLDVQVGYRADGSPWELGYRFVRWTETFEFRGAELTDTTTTKTGPLVNYLFSPGAQRSWYVGAALYKWSQKEESLRTGTTGEDSRVAPFFGGGYRGAFLGRSYFNLGAYLSPTKLTTRTADSMEETTGADLQVQLGITF